MSALSDVTNALAPLPRETALALLDAARAAYRSDAAFKAAEIELLTFGQTAQGQVGRFDVAYQNVLYSSEVFVDELSWQYAKKVTRELAALAGAVGDEGVATGIGAVKQLGSDVAAGGAEIIGKVGDSIPYLVLAIVALAVIVVVK